MFNYNEGINAETIKSISQQIKAGAQYENPTIELKRIFWDISDDKGKNEFAKDLTIMANSKYGAGNIIVGIDGKTGDLYHSTLPVDIADLANIINRKVQEPFKVEFKEIQLDEKNIIVVHIPYSFNKPHILRSYNNREMFIPMRNGTRTVPADKFDLDLMYTERERVVIPPYRLEPINGGKQLTIIPQNFAGNTFWACLINVLNTGSRINMIIDGNLKIYSGNKEIAKLKLTSYFIPDISSDWQEIKNNDFVKIPHNDAAKVNLGFKITDPKQYTNLNSQLDLYSAQITLIDVVGNETFTDIISLTRNKIIR